MGFKFTGGSGGNNDEIIFIPQPKIEVLKTAFDPNNISDVVKIQVYSDLQENQNWLNYNPKIFLFRFKSKNRSSKNQYFYFHPQRWSHPEHSNDAINEIHIGKKTSEWDIDTTNSTQIQASLPKVELKRNNARVIEINCLEYFKPFLAQFIEPHPTIPLTFVITEEKKYMLSNQTNKFNGIKQFRKDLFEFPTFKRRAEYFKFAYAIFKNNKIYVGEMSTQTLKIRYEKYRSINGEYLQPVGKIV